MPRLGILGRKLRGGDLRVEVDVKGGLMGIQTGYFLIMSKTAKQTFFTPYKNKYYFVCKVQYALCFFVA